MPNAATHTVARRWPPWRRSEKSNSMPISNISRMRPIWLMIVSGSGDTDCEHLGEQAGRQRAEERRPEQHADEDLADHPRLMDARGQRPGDAAGGHDDGELQQHTRQDHFGLVHR